MEKARKEIEEFLGRNWRKAFEMWFCCMLSMGKKIQDVIPRDIRTGLPFSLLYEIGIDCGRRAGKWLTEEFHLENKDIREKVQYSNAFFTCSGAGEIEFLKENGKRILRFKNGTFLAKQMGRTGMKVCYYMAGFIAGVTEEFVKREFVAEEIHCLSQGDEHCDFLVTPKS